VRAGSSFDQEDDPMLKWLIKNRLNAFERRFGYDVTYARELLATDTRAFLHYARVAGLSAYRRDVPVDVYYAAKLTAIVAEDCGPCSQLVVAMALGDGVDPRTVAAVVAGDEHDAVLGEPARLGVRFARAVLAHDPAADELREIVARRWGPRAVVSLAFAITASRLFPTLKYALGHGKACQRVEVAGEVVVPRRAREVAVLQAMS
jgi:alkylhydroperoxidase family enzyme